MSASITHRSGAMEGYDPSKIPALIAELHAYDDDEHSDVAVSHESGWTISAFASGLVIWEDAETDDEPRHMRNVSDLEVAHLMYLAADANFDEINAYHWLPGYG